MGDGQQAAIQETNPVKLKVAALAVPAAMLIPLLAACSGSSSGTGSQQSSQPKGPGNASHGPFFSECGGVSDQTVGQLTRVTGLVNTARNSVGCQWLAGGGIIGPHFSFTWYRGSPIGRERKTEELSRSSVEDLNMDGHPGWMAIGSDPVLGDNLCEIGIQFGDDFFEWSVSFSDKPFPNPCDVAKELSRQSIAASK